MAEHQVRGDYYPAPGPLDMTRSEEIQQAWDSDYPALALCRLKGLRVIDDAEAELKRVLANDFFTYICDLESKLERREMYIGDLKAKIGRLEGAK